MRNFISPILIFRNLASRSTKGPFPLNSPPPPPVARNEGGLKSVFLAFFKNVCLKDALPKIQAAFISPLLIFRNLAAMMLATSLCAQIWASPPPPPSPQIRAPPPPPPAHNESGLESAFVTLRFKNARLKEVLLKIQAQSAYNF